MFRLVPFLFVALLALPAQAAGRRHPFEQGNVRLTLASAFGVGQTQDGYVVVGAGLGYFVLDGLELGLDVEHYFGADPTITRVSPQVTFNFYMLRPLPPYVGVFYRHWFVDGTPRDLDTLGMRAGATLVASGGVALGAGAVYERILQPCEGDACDALYPELHLAVTF